MIISIGGTPGSGKSTIAKLLAQKLSYKRYYMGGVRRELARRHGMTLAELNAVGENEFWTDQEVDEYQKKLGRDEDNFVIEGRTSFFLIPHSLKIFLTVSPAEGARRIFGSLRKKSDRNEDSGLRTLADVERSINQRMSSDRKRYRKYYNLDVYDPAHYDFVLDTEGLNVSEVMAQVLNFITRQTPKNRIDK